MPRVIVSLKPKEGEALLELAMDNGRDPRQQAAWLIRQWLIRAGYLPQPEPPYAGQDNESR